MIDLSFLGNTPDAEKKKRFLRAFFFITDQSHENNPEEYLRNLDVYKSELRKIISELEFQTLRQFALKKKGFKTFLEEEGGVSSLSSPEAWKNHWKHLGQNTGIKWFNDEEIRLYRMPGIEPSVAPPIIQGINDMINEIGLNLQTFEFRLHQSIVQQVRQVTDRNGRIDPRKLGELHENEDQRKPEKGGKQHADVVILNQLFAQRPEDFGSTRFSDGSMVISLHGNRQGHTESLRCLAKHEAGHLLGYQLHCDENYAKVTGYPIARYCLMHYEYPSPRICQKCKDAIVSFWEGIQEKTGKRFFKRFRFR